MYEYLVYLCRIETFRVDSIRFDSNRITRARDPAAVDAVSFRFFRDTHAHRGKNEDDDVSERDDDAIVRRDGVFVAQSDDVFQKTEGIVVVVILCVGITGCANAPKDEGGDASDGNVPTAGF